MLRAHEKYLQLSIRYLKGVGPKRSEAFQRLGIETVEDLFYYFPRRYEDRSHFVPIKDIQPGQFATVKGEVLNSRLKRIRRMTIFELTIGDESGFIYGTWFNQPYLQRQFREGDAVILSGKVEFYNNRLQLNSPDYEVFSGSTEDTIHTGRIVPIYPLTEGLGQRGIRRAMRELVEGHAAEAEEYLPSFLREKMGLIELREAIRNVHFPENFESLERARERMVFDEFFLFELALLARIHRDRNHLIATAILKFDESLRSFREKLPFKLTSSQEDVLAEIGKDVAGHTPMRRLLQGDVGSGKTVVAAFFLFLAVRNGLQAVLMAPTEVLAEQHFQTLQKLLSSFNVRIALLTGNTPDNERGEVLADLRNQKINILVGTHAVIQDSVQFARLGLAVIDEQHKFGVRQRAALLSGERRPHLLVMTATPIPRTLGLTLYGDLDISTITELPSGRKPIQTYWINKTKEKEILSHVAAKAKTGEQAYIIFPIIEETEKLDVQAATKEFENLQKGVFSDLRVGLIHGRLSKWDKERVMRDFKDGKIHVLVATSLVEVGIDVPNATMMVIEHADRFGLSQLHQLRGRIGRGSRESYCFLFGDPQTEEGKVRLRVLTKSTDGFKIAEEDLRLRGPGDFLGTRQSGVPLFKIADLIRDGHVLRLARREALSIVQSEGGVAKYPPLAARMENEAKRFFNQIRD